MLCACRATRHKKRWDALLDEIIDEHVASRSSSVVVHGGGGDDDDDFIDVLLSLEQEYCTLTREQVKAILMDMYAAGTDTSSIVLEHTMVELIRNPHVMTRLQAEITSNTPKGQKMVKEEDLMNNMAYLKAVVKETLRLHPPAPLLLPRITMSIAMSTGTQSQLEPVSSSTHGLSAEIPGHGTRQMSSCRTGFFIILVAPTTHLLTT